MRLSSVATLSLAFLPALAFACAVAGAAQAQSRLSDSEFVKAAQCTAMTKDRAEAGAFESLVKAERDGRADLVRLEAEGAKNKAKAFLDQASMKDRRKLKARFENECAPLLEARSVHAAPAA